MLKSQFENNVLTIFLEGKIDSLSAPGLEEEINQLHRKYPAETIILDCDKLEYTTSAGLRVILRVKQEVDDTRLINVHSEIYDIFDMTGFTEMMTIEKAYRVISVEGCEVIGQGANGKIYRIDRDTIVKVFLNADALEEIHRQRELARTAFVLGIPTAIPFDVVRIESGGLGSVYELLNATSYAKLKKKKKKTLDEVAEMSIKMLKLIHSKVVKPGSMPDMKAVALDWADFLKDYLSEELYTRLHALIEAVPVDMHMMHGDYHIKNVMLQNGESLLIDMDTLCHGHPIFELASMYNSYEGYSVLGILERMMNLFLLTSKIRQKLSAIPASCAAGYAGMALIQNPEELRSKTAGRFSQTFCRKQIHCCSDQTVTDGMRPSGRNVLSSCLLLNSFPVHRTGYFNFISRR